jgi:hypothetical protein
MPAQRSPASFIVLALCLAFAAPLLAQEATEQDIENSKFQFTGVVNANAVYVRSGPSENDYPTIKLDKGAEVTAVGHRFEWLKIIPPEGSFCYVAKAYVDRRGNGSVGRVTSTLNVRVGSQLNELKARIASKLDPGADVEIIGEEQEYFKIKPPQGVYFYINKQFVDPVRQANPPVAAQPAPMPVPQNPVQTEPEPSVTPPADADAPPVISQNPAPGVTEPPAAVENPVTPGPQLPERVAERAAPSTQPSADEIEFDKLETRYSEASLKPLDEQPVSDLLGGYQKLAASEKLPESLRRIAEFRTQVLQSRLDVQQQFADTRKQQDEMKQKQRALKAEQDELQHRIKETDFQFYTAVGTLRPSSLQQGTETLYRLTDPANGRTTVYIRSNDGKIATMIGQFIGVKGDVQEDPQLNLRIVSPTSFELVNPARVGQSVAAQIVPASLLPGGSTARTD